MLSITNIKKLITTHCIHYNNFEAYLDYQANDTG